MKQHIFSNLLFVLFGSILLFCVLASSSSSSTNEKSSNDHQFCKSGLLVANDALKAVKHLDDSEQLWILRTSLRRLFVLINNLQGIPQSTLSLLKVFEKLQILFEMQMYREIYYFKLCVAIIVQMILSYTINNKVNA